MTQSKLVPETQIALERGLSQISELVSARVPMEQIQAMVPQIAEQTGADKFQLMQVLPHFVQAASKNVDAAQVYENFRIPGREEVIHDRREEGKGGAERAEGREHARRGGETEMEIRKGRLVRSQEKSYENYLGDRMGRGAPAEAGEAESKIERLLSAFEQMVVERFEGGRAVARESADGKPRFLAKTEAQWKEFFSKFLDRMVAKKVSFDEIQEFLFRGIVPKGNKGIVISDMVLSNGRIEKFVRFSVIADALAQLKALMPGDVFGRERLSQMTGEELMYLALAVSRGKEMPVSLLPTAGKFISGSTEERAAQELGIPIGGTQTEMRAQQMKARGRRPFTGLFDEREGEPEDLPYQFIPWWHWGNLKKPVKSRWATIAFYATLLALALIGIGVLTYRLLSGGV